MMNFIKRTLTSDTATVEHDSATKTKNNITNSLYWWLNKRRPFIINDEYKIELLHVHSPQERGDFQRVKILVTNLKTNVVEEINEHTDSK